MNAIEIARRFAQLGQTADAQKAFLLALANDPAPEEELEAAVYLLQTGYDYRVAYTSMQKLYNAGQFRQILLPIMTEAFYQPNLDRQRQRYRRNCRALAKYPYLFRQDFVPFDELPLLFYPFDDNGYLPFDPQRQRFGEYVAPKHPQITRNFFRDLQNPILASDVYSQYELEYLNDNVRKSEWCAKENHIYLHYTAWPEFCSWLCVLDWRSLLKEQKIVFLIEEEKALYPIDFKQRFGLDYSQYTVKPFSIREVNRLIWHTQLSSHNGGDFFNEILYGHPNVLSETSIMMDTMEQTIRNARLALRMVGDNLTTDEFLLNDHPLKPTFFRDLRKLRDLTDKDIMVAVFMEDERWDSYLDPNARIAPALLFQPHFSNMVYEYEKAENGAVLRSKEYEKLRDSAIFQGFKYIKTFTPMRRPTTAYAGAVRFMYLTLDDEPAPGRPPKVAGDELTVRILNRSFMVDWQDRLFTDSRLVRFEDGKLNTKATFTALAEFLDIPYTQSMTYCSDATGVDPGSTENNKRGLSTDAVYRTREKWADNAERAFIEYCLKDAYEQYGYDFNYYDGGPVDEARIEEWLSQCSTMDRLIQKSWRRRSPEDGVLTVDGRNATAQEYEEYIKQIPRTNNENRRKLAMALLYDLRFVNRNGQPLRYMKKLELDPALLEQPLYR